MAQANVLHVIRLENNIGICMQVLQLMNLCEVFRVRQAHNLTSFKLTQEWSQIIVLSWLHPSRFTLFGCIDTTVGLEFIRSQRNCRECMESYCSSCELLIIFWKYVMVWLIIALQIDSGEAEWEYIVYVCLIISNVSSTNNCLLTLPLSMCCDRPDSHSI